METWRQQSVLLLLHPSIYNYKKITIVSLFRPHPLLWVKKKNAACCLVLVVSPLILSTTCCEPASSYRCCCTSSSVPKLPKPPAALRARTVSDGPWFFLSFIILDFGFSTPQARPVRTRRIKNRAPPYPTPKTQPQPCDEHMIISGYQATVPGRNEHLRH